MHRSYSQQSIDRSISQRVVPSHDASNYGWDEGKYTHYRYEGIPSKKRSRIVVVVVEIIAYNGVDGHRMWTIDHHHIAYRVLYSSSMIITSIVYHKVTPCAIGRDDVLCDDDKEIVMMIMNEGDKQTANVDYDDNDWRRHVLFYELK